MPIGSGSPHHPPWDCSPIDNLPLSMLVPFKLSLPFPIPLIHGVGNQGHCFTYLEINCVFHCKIYSFNSQRVHVIRTKYQLADETSKTFHVLASCHHRVSHQLRDPRLVLIICNPHPSVCHLLAIGNVAPCNWQPLRFKVLTVGTGVYWGCLSVSCLLSCLLFSCLCNAFLLSSCVVVYMCCMCKENCPEFLPETECGQCNGGE